MIQFRMPGASSSSRSFMFGSARRHGLPLESVPDSLKVFGNLTGRIRFHSGRSAAGMYIISLVVKNSRPRGTHSPEDEYSPRERWASPPDSLLIFGASISSPPEVPPVFKR